MKIWLLSLFLIHAYSTEKDFDFPLSDDRITWDQSAIHLFYADRDHDSKKELYLQLKGNLMHSNPQSLTIQAEGAEAIRARIKGKAFFESVEIPKVPNKVRLWLEHHDGKAIKVSSYDVVIRSKPRSEVPKDKLINY